MATINLAPGTQYLTAIRQRRRFLFGLSAVIILVVVATGTGFFLINQATTQTLQQAQGELTALERSIAEAGPDVERITLFEERLAAIDSLLDRHSRYTPILQELERLLPPPAVVTNLAIDTQLATVEITGTTPTIDEVSQALASLATAPGRTTFFSRADMQSILRNEVKSADGAPSVIEYIFKVKLPFDTTILYGAAR